MNVEQLATIEGIRAENVDGLSVLVLNDGEVALINEKHSTVSVYQI